MNAAVGEFARVGLLRIEADVSTVLFAELSACTRVPAWVDAEAIGIWAALAMPTLMLPAPIGLAATIGWKSWPPPVPVLS